VTKYIRYQSGSAARYGILDGESVRELEGDLFNHKETGVTAKLSGVKLLAPVVPPKIFCVGLNYRSHLGSRPQPPQPEIFYKPVTAVQDPEGDIVIPRDAVNLHYEGELVVVIGKRVRNVSRDEARDAIFGVTCGNDVSERDWQDADGQWSRAKGFDTSCPLGPWLETEINPDHLQIRGWLDGKLQQDSDTSDLFHKAGKLVWFVSQYFTMEPGDVIMTGTPAHPGRMQDGSEYTVEIEGIGKLTNRIRKAAQS
jgi:2-keto-4-pentenoate hydratase/2-oxohepta-3-ene-1,7-dioic acid hydratase in catechol pathway